jgi:hypothetical protein
VIFCGSANRFPEYYKEDPNDEEDTELQIKQAVRDRDGNRCRDCGMTGEESRKKYGKELDVHRLLPGSYYLERSCVTLCRACHAKKPKKRADVFWGDDLLWLGFSFYDAREAKFISMLVAESVLRNTAVDEVLVDVLEAHYARHLQRDYEDAVMQSDGLW